MYKIRRVGFHNHPILKNLQLDFCDNFGKAVDTVIIAGENGCGKSTILNELFKISTHSVDSEMDVEFEDLDRVFTISYRKHDNMIYANDGLDMNAFIRSSVVEKSYPFSGIYSDVDINFNCGTVSSVTSLNLCLMKIVR